ncbi:MAG: hypothetical protein KKE89_02880, partial [Actinobacteria bacterium]|nr:hypothetical protein [Actinomycetota bacterium]
MPAVVRRRSIGRSRIVTPNPRRCATPPLAAGRQARSVGLWTPLVALLLSGCVGAPEAGTAPAETTVPTAT